MAINLTKLNFDERNYVEDKETGIRYFTYITPEEIQTVINMNRSLETWVERKYNTDMVGGLLFLTNIDGDTINEHTYDEWKNSGVIDKVKQTCENWNELIEAIAEDESIVNAITRVANSVISEAQSVLEEENKEE